MIVPRRFRHQGRVIASGLLVVRDRKARVLRLWRPGTEVQELSYGSVILFDSPRRIHALQDRGTPLVRHGPVLSTCPLDADELEALAPPSGAIVVAHHGTAGVVSGTPVDPASWLQLDEWVVAEPIPLTAPLPPPIVVATNKASRRGIFQAEVGQMPQEALDFLDALEKGAPRLLAPTDGNGGGWGALRGLLKWLRTPGVGAGGGGKPGNGGITGSKLSAARAPARPRGPSWLDRLDSWFAERAFQSGLGALVQQSHNRFLNEMIQRLEGTDLLDALRYAIPLGGEPGAGPGRLAGFLRAGPRDALSFGGASGPASVIPMGEDVLSQLKRLYERVLNKLIDAGNVTEAAYVYAHLLGDANKAVDLLEAHNLWEKAAEVAENSDLPPERTVALWFRAGNLERAVAIARRHNCFGLALTILERKDPEQARLFRLMWSSVAAASGDYVLAVRVLLPLNSPGLGALFDRAIEAGGQSAPDLLALRLIQYPQEFDAVAGPLARLADEPGRAGMNARLRFASTLTTAPITHSSRAAADRIVRSLFIDLSTMGGSEQQRTLTWNLANKASVGLAADLPGRDDLPQPRGLGDGPLLTAEVGVAECGTRDVKDAIILPNGNVLVALGEAGIRLLDANGRLLVGFKQPAHQLAVSETGELAIGLAERGDRKRLTRIDLVKRSARHWYDFDVWFFADQFDHRGWLVSQFNRVYLLDTAAQTNKALWTTQTDGAITDLVFGQGVGLLTRSPDEVTIHWSFNNNLRLTQRKDLEKWPGVEHTTRLLEPFAVETWHRSESQFWSQNINAPRFAISDGPIAVVANHLWSVVVHREEGGTRVRLSTRGGRFVTDIRLRGATRARAHLQPNHLTLSDDRGRVLGWDLGFGGWSTWCTV